MLKVVLSDGQQRGSLFAPIHWSGETASSARVGDLVAPHTDPFSGQPEAKATPARSRRVTFAYRGFALAARAARAAGWNLVGARGAARRRGILLATNDAPMAWHDRAPDLFPQAGLAEYVDGRTASIARRRFVDGRLEGCLFVGPADAPPQWDA